MTRTYPTCCTSAFCGKGSESCPACPNGPTLAAFKEWRDRTKATQPDPIWCPSFWRATKPNQP